MLTQIRQFFAERQVLEVQTPLMSKAGNTDVFVPSISTNVTVQDKPQTHYLHTSPEFAMKRMLASWKVAIYQICPVFRDNEVGSRHNSEFTMLEWYRAGETYQALMDDCADMLALAAKAAGREVLSYRDRITDPFATPERITVAQAFSRHAGVDLLASIDASGETDRDMLAESLRKAGIRVARDDTWADLFSRVIVEKVEPNLGLGRATILYEYPVAEAALARPTPHDRRVAERFELYACGVELANAFGELTDAGEQRRRFGLEMAEKQRVYGETYPLDEDFLSALAIMPEASGAALGFDRLVMLATGAPRIDQVIWAPVAETAR